MSRVLVTAIGSFAGELVISRLKHEGHTVVGCDIYPKEWIASSKDADLFFQVPKALEADKYMRSVNKICDEQTIEKIIPLTDIEIDFYCRNIDHFVDKNVKVLISDINTIKLCRNKWNMYESIKSAALPIKCIPSCLADTAAEDHITFPVICKPLNGRSSQGIYNIENSIDWNHFAKKEKLSNYIVQKRINGIVVAVDVIRDKYNTAVVVPRKELLRTGNGAGTTVEVFYDKDLTEQCICLANALNTIGCVCFEFILDETGNYYFLECNPRFAGGSVFTLLAGYDCVSNHMKAFNGDKIQAFALDRRMIISRRYSEFIMEEENCYE